LGSSELRLIAKADAENRAKLGMAFPDHAEAYEEWNNSHGVDDDDD
jgi:hypothetical protein